MLQSSQLFVNLMLTTMSYYDKSSSCSKGLFGSRPPPQQPAQAAMGALAGHAAFSSLPTKGSLGAEKQDS
uniref:Uncharacterized protein n=1 Tax=Arundo donax TaxID=35708 RepID=A0A0A9E9F6_ARUDO